MEFKLELLKDEKGGDDVIQQMLGDILASLRAKLVQPVIDGNARIACRLDELDEQNRVKIAELMERLQVLEDKVRQLPLVILSALRDAINQAGGGNEDV
ncbi:MAG: hypothetical protein HPY89_01520 [Pelotomaculum sp.]|uniref:Uncharacterized protein n=1 Tax=Pelotomaculum thermopropionicum (strain DSM 13744 / JCM 10971 / SI) TaxID=370438 RepID=A5D0N4_PELTS|nr:hypothetical protein [Pelotomaculum sp.]BAF60204.1 hypothetical protein PTH_2023 [Pelotomaculum thermopropionicum SI]